MSIIIYNVDLEHPKRIKSPWYLHMWAWAIIHIGSACFPMPRAFLNPIPLHLHLHLLLHLLLLLHFLSFCCYFSLHSLTDPQRVSDIQKGRSLSTSSGGLSSSSKNKSRNRGSVVWMLRKPTSWLPNLLQESFGLLLAPCTKWFRVLMEMSPSVSFVSPWSMQYM